jgi:excisionase family DNA binding protein
MNHDTLYTPAEAAEILRVTKGCILRWIRAGALSASRLTQRHIVIRGADLDAFVESCRIPSALAVGSALPVTDEIEEGDEDEEEGFLGVDDDDA